MLIQRTKFFVAMASSEDFLKFRINVDLTNRIQMFEKLSQNKRDVDKCPKNATKSLTNDQENGPTAKDNEILVSENEADNDLIENIKDTTPEEHEQENDG